MIIIIIISIIIMFSDLGLDSAADAYSLAPKGVRPLSYLRF